MMDLMRGYVMRRKLFSVTIKDCRVDTFTVGGHGGAGKDTSNTGVRVYHPASGALAISTDSRSQLKNKQTAFKRMAETRTFQVWCRLKAAAIASGKTVEELVEEQMQVENLRVEYRTAEGWKEVKDVEEIR